MTAQAEFTEEEWARVRRAPMVAGMAITLADPGGPIEVFKETSAVLKVVTEADGQGRDDLVGKVAREVRELARNRTNPLGDFKPQAATAREQILEELSQVRAIVAAKVPGEEAPFSAWLMECARRAAEAAKEGGFMGFHAVRVSEGEQQMLDQLASALGVSRA